MLAAELRQPTRVPRRGRVGQQALDLRGAGERVGQPFPETQAGFPYF